MFSFLVNSVINFGNLCNFHILSLNSLTNPSTNIPFVIVTKYAILDNLSQTTKITSFLATTSNFVIKSTVRYIHGLSGTSFTSSLVPLSSFSFSDIYHIYSYIFLYLLLLLAISNFLSPILSFSLSLYILLLVYHGITRLSLLSAFYPLAYILSPLSTPSLLLLTTCYLLILLLPSSSSFLLLFSSYFYYFLVFIVFFSK